MDRRIRQNGLAHSPKWTSACMIHHTCVYIRAGWGLLRLGTLSRGLGPPGPTPQKPPAHSNIYTCIVYHACAGPFWRMRQSISSNAPVYFGECLILLNICTQWRILKTTHSEPWYRAREAAPTMVRNSCRVMISIVESIIGCSF